MAFAAPKVSPHVAVTVNILVDVLELCHTDTASESDVSPLVVSVRVIGQRIESQVELPSVPQDAIIDALAPWHTPIADHLAEESRAYTDVGGGLKPREPTRR
jgi:hypothetical protein